MKKVRRKSAATRIDHVSIGSTRYPHDTRIRFALWVAADVI